MITRHLLLVGSLILMCCSVSTSVYSQQKDSGGLKTTAASEGIVLAKRPYAPRGEVAVFQNSSISEMVLVPKGPNEKGSDLKVLINPPTVKRLPYKWEPIPEIFPNRVEVLFMGEARPVRIRIHLMLNGKPLSDAWMEQLKKTFDYFDRDGSGALNAAEVENVFTSAAVLQMMQQGVAFRSPADSLTIADHDLDRDLRISPDELAAYYSKALERLVSVSTNQAQDPFSSALTDELFKRLDHNSDGRLSKEELETCEKLLMPFDSDEDELVAALELIPNLNSRQLAPRPLNVAANDIAPLTVAPISLPEDLSAKMLKKYDRDSNYRLTVEEMKFEEAFFRQIDRNRDGFVSINEIERWRRGPPDLEWSMNYSNRLSERAVKLHPQEDGTPYPLAKALRVFDDGRVVLKVGTQVVDFGFVASPQTLVRNDPLGVTNLFTRIDGEEKYIEEKDIAGPQYQALRTVFDAADRNNDGRLTRSEYEAFFRLQSSFQDLPLGFNHSIQTPGLFNLIDTSQDGRLGVRELRKAWERLKDLEPDTSDSISRAAIKPHGQIMFGRASQVVFVQPRSVLNPPAIPTQTRGPIWYRKMDRNGDGDISRREFLGAKELFDRMDANHDDMISFEEAEAFDSTTRKKE